jgi:hypothetical protein
MSLVFLGIIHNAVESRTMLRDVAMESHNGDDREAKYHSGGGMSKSGRQWSVAWVVFACRCAPCRCVFVVLSSCAFVLLSPKHLSGVNQT